MDAITILQRHHNWVKTNFELNSSVESRLNHISRVFGLVTRISENDNMRGEDQFIAQVVAALHDVGRFPQIEKYDTFIDDERYNHSTEGAKMLQDGLLQQLFPETRKYDAIIITAVKCHGLPSLPTNIKDEKIMRQIKLIRDADRTDIFEESVQYFDYMFKSLAWGESKKITPKIKELFENRKPMLVKDLKSKLDMLALRLGLLSQYEFVAALQLIEQKDYINRLTQMFLEKTDYDPKEILWLREKAIEQLNLRKQELN